jgi:DNA modification methylase
MRDEFNAGNSRITLYNANCFDLFDDGSLNGVDAIVCDPPYSINYVGTTSDTSWDHMSDDEYVSLLENLFHAVDEALKPNSSMWMFCGPTKMPVIFETFNTTEHSLMLNLENWCIYARAKGRSASHKLKSVREDVLHISKGDYSPKWHSVEYLRRVVVPYMKEGKPRGWALDQSTGEPVRWSGLGNVMFFTQPYYLSKFEKQIHSCQKSVLALCELIMLTTSVGDTVLDPFAGSMSTGVAAAICDRNFIGVEGDLDMYKKGRAWLQSLNFDEANNYVKSRVSSSEEGFKFGFDKRVVLPKKTRLTK